MRLFTIALAVFFGGSQAFAQPQSQPVTQTAVPSVGYTDADEQAAGQLTQASINNMPLLDLVRMTEPGSEGIYMALQAKGSPLCAQICRRLMSEMDRIDGDIGANVRHERSIKPEDVTLAAQLQPERIEAMGRVEMVQTAQSTRLIQALYNAAPMNFGKWIRRWADLCEYIDVFAPKMYDKQKAAVPGIWFEAFSKEDVAAATQLIPVAPSLKFSDVVWLMESGNEGVYLALYFENRQAWGQIGKWFADGRSKIWTLIYDITDRGLGTYEEVDKKQAAMLTAEIIASLKPKELIQVAENPGVLKALAKHWPDNFGLWHSRWHHFTPAVSQFMLRMHRRIKAVEATLPQSGTLTKESFGDMTFGQACEAILKDHGQSFLALCLKDGDIITTMFDEKMKHHYWLCQSVGGSTPDEQAEAVKLTPTKIEALPVAEFADLPLKRGVYSAMARNKESADAYQNRHKRVRKQVAQASLPKYYPRIIE